MKIEIGPVQTTGEKIAPKLVNSSLLPLIRASSPKQVVPVFVFVAAIVVVAAFVVVAAIVVVEVWQLCENWS